MVGYGVSCDAYHMTAPAPEGIGGAKAMINALQDASLEANQIDYINAHGTSTPSIPPAAHKQWPVFPFVEDTATLWAWFLKAFLIANHGRKQVLNYVMSNSLGFGGHNASIIFKKYGEEKWNLIVIK